MFKHLLGLCAVLCGLHVVAGQGTTGMQPWDWNTRTRCKGESFLTLCPYLEWPHVEELMMGKSKCASTCCPSVLLDNCVATANRTLHTDIYDDVVQACSTSRSCAGIKLDTIYCYKKPWFSSRYFVDYIIINYTCSSSPQRSTVWPPVTATTRNPYSYHSTNNFSTASIVGMVTGSVMTAGLVFCLVYCYKRKHKSSNPSNTSLQMNSVPGTAVTAPPGGHQYPLPQKKYPFVPSTQGQNIVYWMPPPPPYTKEQTSTQQRF